MPRTALTVTTADRGGTVALPAYVGGDNVNGNTIPNTGNELVVVKNNSGGASGTVTFEVPAVNAPDGATITNSGRQYTLANTAEICFGPFPPGIYNQADGTLWADVSAASMQFRVVRLNR